MNVLALIVMVIGALNWGLIGLFHFDLKFVEIHRFDEIGWLEHDSGKTLQIIDVLAQDHWSAQVKILAEFMQ